MSKIAVGRSQFCGKCKDNPKPPLFFEFHKQPNCINIEDYKQ